MHAAAAEWRKRSQLIHFFRRALPVAIVVIAAALLLWVVGKSVWSNFTGLQAREGAQIRVTNARFYGQDELAAAFWRTLLPELPRGCRQIWPDDDADLLSYLINPPLH